MFYKLGQNAALDTLGFGGVQETPLNVPNPFETLGFKKKHEGYFGISGAGRGAIMGTAIGTSVGTGAHSLSNLLGINILERTGLTLPQLVALTGLLGAGVGAGYGASLPNEEE